MPFRTDSGTLLCFHDRKQSARAAGVEKQHLIIRPEGAFLRHGNKPRESFSGIYGIKEQPFAFRHQRYRCVSRF